MNFEVYDIEQQEKLLFILNLLKLKKYSDVYKFACKFVNTYNYKKSEIICENSLKAVNYIKNIMLVTPKILQDLSADKLEEIKIYTVFCYLLGYKLSAKKIPFILKNFDTGIKYDVNVCMDMIRKSAWSRNKINKIRKGDCVLVTVSSGCSKPCEYYNLMYKDKQFELKDAPEIPNPNCILEIGCQCLLKVRYL